jgi:predicted TIM-barrel enzyme
MDAILISGWAAGSPMAVNDLVLAKEAAPETPVVANTGVRLEHIAEILNVSDGAIVGTSLKRDAVRDLRAHRGGE